MLFRIKNIFEYFLQNVTVTGDLACVANLHCRRPWHRELDATTLLQSVVRNTLGNAVCLVVMVEKPQVPFMIEEALASSR